MPKDFNVYTARNGDQEQYYVQAVYPDVLRNGLKVVSSKIGGEFLVSTTGQGEPEEPDDFRSDEDINAMSEPDNWEQVTIMDATYTNGDISIGVSNWFMVGYVKITKTECNIYMWWEYAPPEWATIMDTTNTRFVEFMDYD